MAHSLGENEERLTLCERYGASGLNLNFVTEAEWRWMGDQGLGRREGQQYHWLNRGYGDFEAWTKSESFVKAHAQARAPQGTYLEHPKFEGFEVIL